MPSDLVIEFWCPFKVCNVCDVHSGVRFLNSPFFVRISRSLLVILICVYISLSLSLKSLQN